MGLLEAPHQLQGHLLLALFRLLVAVVEGAEDSLATVEVLVVARAGVLVLLVAQATRHPQALLKEITVETVSDHLQVPEGAVGHQRLGKMQQQQKQETVVAEQHLQLLDLPLPMPVVVVEVAIHLMVQPQELAVLAVVVMVQQQMAGLLLSLEQLTQAVVAVVERVQAHQGVLQVAQVAPELLSSSTPYQAKPYLRSKALLLGNAR
jgi:hypothetical protein